MVVNEIKDSDFDLSAFSVQYEWARLWIGAVNKDLGGRLAGFFLQYPKNRNTVVTASMM